MAKKSKQQAGTGKRETVTLTSADVGTLDLSPAAVSVNGSPTVKVSTLEKLIVRHTERNGQAPDSKTVDVYKLQAAYVDAKKAAGIGKNAPRSGVTEKFQTELETVVIGFGNDIVEFVRNELPAYKVHALTLQIRNGETKLRTFRIGKPRQPK